MATTVERVTVKIPKALAAEANKLAADSGRDAQEVLEELLEESIRMRRVPGIIFADGPTGRRARIAGTGLEVFELIGGYRSVGEDWDAFRDAYHWLDERQLRAALEYYRAYPVEIDARLVSEAEAYRDWQAQQALEASAPGS